MNEARQSSHNHGNRLATWVKFKHPSQEKPAANDGRNKTERFQIPHENMHPSTRNSASLADPRNLPQSQNKSTIL
jgi:hypothetical protein